MTGHGNRDVTVTFQVTREFYVDTFIIFEFLSLDYGKIDTNIDNVSCVVEKIWQVTEIVTSQSLSRSRVSFYVDTFIIFEFLSLEYGKIDTNIDNVSCVVEKIRKVTEIVTSQSLSRSRVSST